MRLGPAFASVDGIVLTGRAWRDTQPEVRFVMPSQSSTAMMQWPVLYQQTFLMQYENQHSGAHQSTADPLHLFAKIIGPRALGGRTERSASLRP